VHLIDADGNRGANFLLSHEAQQGEQAVQPHLDRVVASLVVWQGDLDDVRELRWVPLLAAPIDGDKSGRPSE
jgi:hypothetical protein